MTVALGCAAFILVATESSDDAGDTSRAIQGIAAGIGFIGAGAILKRSEEEDIQGLTSAATIWLTAAVGVGAGAGQVWLGLVAVTMRVCDPVCVPASVAGWHRKAGGGADAGSEPNRGGRHIDPISRS